MRSKALRSMRLQTAAIVVVTFVLSHLAGYYLYSQDRRGAVLITEALDTAERAAGVSRLLRDLPAAWRDEVVRMSDSRAFRVWTSSEPPFEINHQTVSEDYLLTYLRSQLPRISENEMRVRFAPGTQQTTQPPVRPETAENAALASIASATDPDSMVLAISIDHSDGRWLNFFGQINTSSSFLPEFLGMSIVSAVLGIGLVAFWLVHRVTVPLKELADAAERLGKNIATKPLDESGPAEVATAAAAFNRMQRRLTRLVKGRTELLAAISHDLRTPITQMRLRTELMPPSRERKKNLATLDEMEAIVATFLDYARAANEAEERSRSDVGAIVESLCADLADTGAEVTCTTEDNLVLSCKRLAVKRALANLIENAIQYGERARVEARKADTSVVISVDDDGPGIPEAELEAVLTPFYRTDASRGRHSGGVGLGLSIVQAVAEDHGGEVRLRNRAKGGLRAQMILPM